MAKLSTLPQTVEELRCIEIGFLKMYGYLKPNNSYSGVLTWTSPHGTKNSIRITTTTREDHGSMILDYTYQKTEQINYTVIIATRPANIPGRMWFFVCPFTGRYCRKLHLINGYFRHRSAAPRLMYEKQIQSKKWRSWAKLYGDVMDDEVHRELFKKYYKPHYAGKPTKRHIRLMKKLENRNEFDEEEFYKVFLKK